MDARGRLSGFLIGTLVGVLMLFLDFNRTFEPLELGHLDKRYWKRFLSESARGPSSEIVIVELTDATAQQWKRRSPIPRDYLAQLIRKVAEARPRVVFLDVLLHEPTLPEEDQQLAEALAAARVVVLAHSFTENLAGQRVPQMPLELYSRAAWGVGFALAPMDSDGVYRRSRIARGTKGRLMLSCDAVIWGRLMGVTDAQIKESLLDTASLPDLAMPFTRTRSVNDQSLDYLINYTAPPRVGFEGVRAQDLLEGRGVPATRIAGKVVMIGSYISYLGDRFRTPFFQRQSNQPPQLMAGVEIRAQAMNTMLRQRFIRSQPPGTRHLLMFLMSVVSAGLLGFLSFRFALLLVLVIAWAPFILSDWLFVQQSYRFDPYGPALGALLALFVMGYKLLENEAVERRLQAERAEGERSRMARLAQEKAAVLSTIVHDLKVPITIIKADALTLMQDREGLLGEELREEFLHTIAQQSDRLTQEIDDLLDTDAQREIKLQLSDFALRPLIENVLSLQRTYARGHTFVVECPDELPRLRADKYKLTRVLTNLINNAIKYSPEGGEIRVTVACAHIADSAEGSQSFVLSDGGGATESQVAPNQLVIAVTDPGLGMTSEQQARLFGLFARVLDPDVEIPGTGVGLYSTRRLIEAHGGSIWVESAKNEGSTFTFTIPLRAQRAPQRKEG